MTQKQLLLLFTVLLSTPLLQAQEEPEWVVEPKYDYITNFSEGVACVAINVDDNYGFIDETGREITPLKYKHVYWKSRFSEGLIPVRLAGGEYGFINKLGKEVISFKYSNAESFSEGLALVRLNGECGFIDKTGEEIIFFKYENAKSFSEGLAYVRLNNKQMFVDKIGKEIISLTYDDGWSFSEGLAKVRLGNKLGFIDKTGKEIIPVKYDNAESFSEGLARVNLNGKWGFINKTGKEVIPFKYDNAESFSEGLASVTLNGESGFIDKTGKEIISLTYDNAESFSEGLASVTLNGKWGFINKAGKQIISLKYSSALPFSEGLAGVRLNGKYGYIKHPILSKIKTHIQTYVEERINQWQKKGEFEPTADYQKRVDQQSRNEKIKLYTQEAIDFYGSQFIDLSQKILEKYDADNQTFKVVFSGNKEVYLQVPLSIAPKFKENFATVKLQNPKYGFANNQLIITYIEAVYQGKTYIYDASKQINYTNADIEFNFEPILITSSTSVPKPNNKPTNIVLGKADIDMNLPKTLTINPEAIAVIIGNGNYEKTQKLPYAVQDAQTMKQYLIEVLGFQEGNILYVENASLAEFQTLFGKKDQHKGKLYNTVRPNISDVFVYYSGHGAPDDKASAYFVPTECDPNFVALNGYPLKTFYDNLAKIPAKSFTIVIDACFSGEEITTAGKRPIEVKSKGVAGLQKGTLLASSDGTQFSCDYTEKGHGLFTYFFLKAIHNQNADLNKDKKLTFEEIYQYVNDNAYGVPYEARRLHNTTQNPQLKTETPKEVLVEYK